MHPYVCGIHTFTSTESSHVGSHTLRVRGTDSGGLSDFAEFVLKVEEVNDAPKAPTADLDDKTLYEDVVSTDPKSIYVFDAFTDEETSALTYKTSWAVRDSAGRDIVDVDGEQTFVSLPTWIVFDGLKRRFTFEPDKSWHAGRHTLRVVGTEKGVGDEQDTKRATLRSSFSMSWR